MIKPGGAILPGMFSQNLIFVTALIYGRLSTRWYDYLFLGLAALVVYADNVIDWIGERVGREQGWATLIATVAFGLGAMWLIKEYLSDADKQRFHGFQPIVSLAMLAAVRGMMSLVETLFGFDRD